MLVALRMATNAGQDRNYHYALIGLLNFLRFKFPKDRRPPGYDLKIDSPDIQNDKRHGTWSQRPARTRIYVMT